MNIYLITDTHFNHTKVIEYCGRPLNYEQLLFSSMNNVPEDAILLHLGDICIGKDVEVHEKYIAPLKCKKWLIKGNHDRKSDAWYYEHGWDVVCESINIIKHGVFITFSHKPIPLPRTRGSKPVINIHGHFHNTDHRLIEPDMDKILTKNHKLLAVEYTNYQVVDLAKFVTRA
jgi:calcineurin-like phosphoesterase family protein